MWYAVIQTGGKQYKVKSGEILKIEKLSDSKPDTKIEFKEVLAYGDNKIIEVGSPIVQGAKVEANLIKNSKNIVGKYLFAYSQAEASKLLGLNLARPSVKKNVLGPQPKLINKFRVILDENERVYFTDGSLLIKFNTNVNFSEFASVNNLMLKKEYIDLNMGVYVHNNFNNLENKIESLQEISSISNVQYNVIDPYILPE